MAETPLINEKSISSFNAFTPKETSYYVAVVAEEFDNIEALREKFTNPDDFRRLPSVLTEKGVVTYKTGLMEDDAFGVITRLPSGKLVTCLVRNEWICETKEAASETAEELSNQKGNMALVLGVGFLPRIDS